VAKIAFKYSGNVYDAAPAGTVDFPLVTPSGKAIPYLERAHIHVYSSADAGVTWTELTRPTQWDFDSAGRIARLKTAVTPDWVMVRRITPYDSKYTTFQDSSLLTAEQLNEGEDFSMFVDQEISDLSGIASLSTLGQLVTTAMQKAGQWVSDDVHLATTGALSERFDVYVQDTKPADPPITERRQPGKLWIDSGTFQFHYWEPAARAWVAIGAVGPAGAAGTIRVGATRTLAPGQPAAVTNSGTTSAAVFDFAIPQGPQGLPGSTGPAGPPGGSLTHTGTSPITVTTVGSTVTYGFNLIPLATLP